MIFLFKLEQYTLKVGSPVYCERIGRILADSQRDSAWILPHAVSFLLPMELYFSLSTLFLYPLLFNFNYTTYGNTN